MEKDDLWERVYRGDPLSNKELATEIGNVERALQGIQGMGERFGLARSDLFRLRMRLVGFRNARANEHRRAASRTTGIC